MPPKRKLPEHYTRPARDAARFIEPIPERDRDTVIKAKMAGWWDNGSGLDEWRKYGSIESVYNYAAELSAAGVPDYLINIRPRTATSYDLYASRDSG